MEKIVINSETADFLISKINSITKGNYFSIQLGNSDLGESPYGEDSAKIRWKEEVDTNYNVSVKRGLGDNPNGIVFSRHPSHSAFVFFQNEIIFLSEDEIIFQSESCHLREKGNFLYIRIKPENEQVEEKFSRYVQKCEQENKRVYDFPEDESLIDFLEDDENVEEYEDIYEEEKESNSPFNGILDES